MELPTNTENLVRLAPYSESKSFSCEEKTKLTYLNPHCPLLPLVKFAHKRDFFFGGGGGTPYIATLLYTLVIGPVM